GPLQEAANRLLAVLPAADRLDPAAIGIDHDLGIGERREEDEPRGLRCLVAHLMSAGFAAWEDVEIPRAEHLLAVRCPQRRRAGEDEQPLLLPDLPVVLALLPGSELEQLAAPELRTKLAAETARPLAIGQRREEVQSPGPSRGGSGLCGRPSRGSPSL